MKSNWTAGAVLVLFGLAIAGIATGFLGGTVSGPPSIEVASTAYYPIEHPDAYELAPKSWPADWVKAVPGQGYQIHIEGIIRNANLSDLQCLWTPVDRNHAALGPTRMARPADALPGLRIEQLTQYEYSFSLHVAAGFRFEFIGERLEIAVMDDDSDFEERVLVIPRTGNP